MLHPKGFPLYFWAESMNISYYIPNRVTLRRGTSTTFYELWKRMKLRVNYFNIFGSKCYYLIDQGQKGKKNPIRDEGIFMGYSLKNRTSTLELECH